MIIKEGKVDVGVAEHIADCIYLNLLPQQRETAIVTRSPITLRIVLYVRALFLEMRIWLEANKVEDDVDRAWTAIRSYTIEVIHASHRNKSLGNVINHYSIIKMLMQAEYESAQKHKTLKDIAFSKSFENLLKSYTYFLYDISGNDDAKFAEKNDSEHMRSIKNLLIESWNYYPFNASDTDGFTPRNVECTTRHLKEGVLT